MKKWSLVRYFHPLDKNLARNRKIDNDLLKEFDFEDIAFPLKIRDIHKVEKKSASALVAFGFENKENVSILISKNTFRKHVDLFLTEGKGQFQYVLIVV